MYQKMTYSICKTVLYGVGICTLVACGGGSSSTDSPEKNVGEKIMLAPLAPGDKGSQELDHLDEDIALPSINASRQDVRFSQVLAEAPTTNNSVDTPPKTFSKGYMKTSKSFKMVVSAADISDGVNVPVSSAAPVIRVIPGEGASAILQEEVLIGTEQGWVSGSEAFETIADENELKAVGFAQAKNTLAMKVKRKAATGPVQLKTSSKALNDGEYYIHVLEAESDKLLELALADNKLLRGESLKVSVKMSKAGKKLDLDKISGYLRGPEEGQTIPVELDIQSGRVNTELDTSNISASAPGLWELHVSSESGNGDSVVMRDAKVAFSLAPKIARFGNAVEVVRPTADDGKYQFEFSVETALAGRYEVSAILYGVDEQGQSKAGVRMAAASWLDASGVITLEVSADTLLDAGIQAPFEIRSLSLKDQTRMAELWSQSNAFAVN